jgi:hypothetical protein
MPFMTGSTMSSTITSGQNRRICSNAAIPFDATETLYPSLTNVLAIKSTIVLSSSTINTLPFVIRYDSQFAHERGSWTWAEFDEAVDQIVALIRSVPQRVDVIVLSPQRFPSGFPLVHLQRVVVLLPRNTGKIVLVNNSPFQRRLNNILMTIFLALKKQVVFVDSVDEAYEVFTERVRVR